MIARIVAGLTVLLGACSGGGEADRANPGSATNDPTMNMPTPPTAAQSIRVVDGDTVDIDGVRHRLAGIDAPERYQRCLDADGAVWTCGRAATQALADLIGAGPVSCSAASQDRYGRSVSSCSADGTELGEALTRAGLAVNDPRYAPDRSDAETEARAEGAGMDAGRFMPPWSWRAGARLSPLSPSLLESDAILTGTGVPIHMESACDAETCTLTLGDETVTISAVDILPERSAGTGPHVRTATTDGGTRLVGFGTWLEESGFAAVAGETAEGTGFAIAVSAADHFPATNPRPVDGGATWSGIATGIDTSRPAVRIEGRTQIEVTDFFDPSLDVLFTEMREIGTDDARPDMAWSGIALREGAFSTAERGDRISGRFYGDTHQEVGGVFERDGIAGAFGAIRGR